jgi:hypothetical protein
MADLAVLAELVVMAAVVVVAVMEALLTLRTNMFYTAATVPPLLPPPVSSQAALVVQVQAAVGEVEAEVAEVALAEVVVLAALVVLAAVVVMAAMAEPPVVRTQLLMYQANPNQHHHHHHHHHRNPKSCHATPESARFRGFGEHRTHVEFVTAPQCRGFEVRAPRKSTRCRCAPRPCTGATHWLPPPKPRLYWTSFCKTLRARLPKTTEGDAI